MEIPKDKMDEMRQMAIDSIGAYVEGISLVTINARGEMRSIYTVQLSIMLVESFTLLAMAFYGEGKLSQDESVDHAINMLKSIDVRPYMDKLDAEGTYDEIKSWDPVEVVEKAIHKAQFTDR